MKQIKRFIKKLLRILNVELRYLGKPEKNSFDFHYDINASLGYDYNLNALRAIRIIRKYSMSPYINLELLFEHVIYCEKNKIEGDLIECGVWKGGAIGLMAIANLEYGSFRRDLRLFDVFDDICEPDPRVDGLKAISEFYQLTGKKQLYAGNLKPVKGIYKSMGGAGSIGENKRLLEEIIRYPEDKIFYYKGWFQETIPKAANEIQKIAVLRLDGDLYASIKTCIEGLYKKLVKGGVFIVDDYGTYEGCRKAIDEFREKNGITTFMNYSNESCRYWFKE